MGGECADMFTRRFLTEADKREICSWKYEGEYSLYNLPSYEEMYRAKSGFMDSQKERNYQAFLLNDKVIGFVNIYEKNEGVFIGIGVRPDACGNGYGSQILTETCRIAKQQYPMKAIWLEVRSWNLRALKCYQKSGFEIVGEEYENETQHGKDWFYRMRFSLE